MTEKRTCPCALADLSLGDTRRVSIMDCPRLSEERHPCIIPMTETEIPKPIDIIPGGVERHTKHSTENVWGLFNTTVLA